MRQRSKSTLFLIEQLIVIAVFAISAAACISILANAYFLSIDARDVSNALIVAESVADSFKASSGDFEAAAEISGAFTTTIDGSEALQMYLNNSWIVSDEQSAQYILRLTSDNQEQQNSFLSANILVVERINGEELVSFPVYTIRADQSP